VTRGRPSCVCRSIDAADGGALLGEGVADHLGDLAGADAGVAVRHQPGLQVLAELGGGLVAVLLLRGHGLVADGAQVGGRVGHHRDDPRVLAGHAAGQDALLVLALHQPAPGDRLPEHDAHREEIGARVDRLAATLLGRDVAELALHRALPRGRRSAGDLGDAEVDELDLTGVGHEHVLRADVAVHHAQRRAVEVGELVGVLQAAQHLDQHPQLHLQREVGATEAAEDRGERLALQVLHGHVVPVAVVADLVGLHDVRVVEAGGDARLLEEHGEKVVVVRQLRAQLLDHQQLVEAGHAPGDGEQHARHTALADLGQDAVLADALAHVSLMAASARWARRRWSPASA
jgi:hypothetical protein